MRKFSGNAPSCIFLVASLQEVSAIFDLRKSNSRILFWTNFMSHVVVILRPTYTACLFNWYFGGAENAGRENDGREIDGPICGAWNSRTWNWRTSVLGMKLQDVKMTDQMTGHENAGHEIARHETTEHKIVRYETGSDAPNVWGRIDWIDLAFLLCSRSLLRYKKCRRLKQLAHLNSN